MTTTISIQPSLLDRIKARASAESRSVSNMLPEPSGDLQVAERNKNGTFKKGTSGNTKGRVAGSGVTGKLRRTILDKSPELLQMLIDKALEEQDTTAAMALLNKVMPNLKAGNEPVAFNLDTGKGLTVTGEQIVQNIADGTWLILLKCRKWIIYQNELRN